MIMNFWDKNERFLLCFPDFNLVLQSVLRESGGIEWREETLSEETEINRPLQSFPFALRAPPPFSPCETMASYDL